MADIPVNTPEDLKGGDTLRASWLNKVKNGYRGLSVTPPLQITNNSFGGMISHGQHVPNVRWGTVFAPYVWSDATYVQVYPTNYTENANGIFTNIVSTDASAIINVYVTNPIISDVSVISDVTKAISLFSDDIIAYSWFGDHKGIMLGGGGGAGLGTAVDPTELLPASFEGTSDAATDTWLVTSDYSPKDGVEYKMTTRVMYDDTGEEILYGFYRTFTITTLGNVLSISGETRYVIDAPEDCGDAEIISGKEWL